MEGLTSGRIVHYVLEDGRYVGGHRPAIVLYVNSPDNGNVNLGVFVDGTNDYPNLPDPGTSWMPVVWRTSRLFDEDGKAPGTWHWIEKA